MEKKNIEFKLIIELDDEKLDRDNYDVEDAYRIVREVFEKNSELERVEDEQGRLVYVSYHGDEKAYGIIGFGGVRLYDSWLRPYIKSIEWHNLDEGTVENIVEELKDFHVKGI